VAKQTLVTIIDADTRKFRNGMRKTAGIAKAIAKGILVLGAVVVTAMAKMTFATAKYGDEVDKMNRRTGIQIDEIQKLILASQLAGTDIGKVEKASKKLSGTILDLKLGLSTAKDGFIELKLGLKDVENKGPAEQLKIVLAALNALDSASLKSAVALKVLGKSGVDLLPLADSLRETLEIAGKDILLLDKDQVKQSADLVDNLTRIKAILGSAIRLLTVQAFPNINRNLGSIITRLRAFTRSDDFGQLKDEALLLAKNLGRAFDQVSGGEIKISSILDLVKELNKVIEESVDNQTFKDLRDILTIILVIIKGIVGEFRKLFELGKIIGNVIAPSGEQTGGGLGNVRRPRGAEKGSPADLTRIGFNQLLREMKRIKDELLRSNQEQKAPS